MGTGGVGLAWREAAQVLHAPPIIGEALLLLTAIVWVLLVGLHLYLAAVHTEAFLTELRHPVRCAFAAAPTIGLMILAAAVHPYVPGAGAVLWSVAVLLHLLVAMLLLRRIVAGRGEAAMMAPPLLIPFVGNILAPAFGVRMGFLDASWMMFGIGLLLWLVVMPMLMHRLLTGPPLPPPLRPAVAIFVAPPAVGAVALAGLSGTAHGPALMLVGIAILIGAVVLSLAGEITAVPFGPAWWGLTFPSAAFAIMTLQLIGHPILGWLALLLTSAITLYVAWRTVLALRSGALLQPEH
jgi:tellurite resistance protein